MSDLLAKLVGFRTVIIFGVLAVAGVLRGRHPESVPDDEVITGLLNTVIDAIVSVPGASIIAIIMRLVTKTPAFKGP